MVRKKWWVYIFLFLFPLLFAIVKVSTGAIPFWYDIARDFLLAQQNLIKPTLIGPTSGIPGLFYGPYWIWYLSSGLLISKDPRVVTFLLATLPYFTIAPLLFMSFSKYIAPKNLWVLWGFFILGFLHYATNLWNPNVAPLIFLSVLAVVTQYTFTQNVFKTAAVVGVIGILCGLLINFHISFGIGVCLATGMFLFSELVQSIKGSYLKKFLVSVLLLFFYTGGVALTFIPTALFEIRHGFHQLTALVFALKQSMLFNSSVVGQVGLTKDVIIEGFFGKFAMLLQTPVFVAFLLYGVVIGYMVALKRNGLLIVTFTQFEKRLVRYLVIVTGVILYIYLSSKNPVWEYHFIGVEILILFSFALVLQKSDFFRKCTVISLVVVVLYSGVQFGQTMTHDPITDSGSYAGIYKVSSDVYKDAKGMPFRYAAHAAAIYTFEYDYVFSVLDTKHILRKEFDSPIVYIIVPIDMWKDREGFLQVQTPYDRYLTVKEWNSPNGTHVFKRALITAKPTPN